MPFEEPADVFFSSLDVKSVIFHLSEGGDIPVSAYFDDPFLDANLGQTEMDTTGPYITCKTSALSRIKEDNTVTVNNAGYRVLKIHPDGTGMSRVYLAHE
jgi:hypothetical protein